MRKKSIKNLDKWQGIYEDSKQKYEEVITRFEKNQKQYDGTLQPEKGKDVKCIYNFTQELLESSIDTGIPQPKVEARTPNERNTELAKIAENMIKGELKRLRFELINDEDERTTKIIGGNIGLAEWNNAKQTHDTSGSIEFRLIDPKQFIPQPGVYDVEKMDYFFLTFNDTKERLEKRYGVNVDNEGLDNDISDNVELESDDIVTQVMCWYKNNKGSLGCFSWVGSTVLIDDEEYQARGEQVCTRCGKTKVIGETNCLCGNNKYEKRSLEYEELTEDVVRADGSVIPAMSYAREPSGEYAYHKNLKQKQEINPANGLYEPVLEQVFDENMLPIGEKPAMEEIVETYQEPTKIPYYVPKSYPVCVRQNISLSKSVLGLSDCEMIREPQMEANKITTKMMYKLANEGTIITKPGNLKLQTTNGIQTIEVNQPEQKSLIDKIDIRYDINSDLNMINQMYLWAKSLLGVNDSSQGKPDTTATSGKAKEIQVQRALGRQASKVTMKNSFYQDIFKTIFEFALAYTDEPRKYNAQNEEGESIEAEFNRYDFLELDEYGNWYYNDEFDFLVDPAGTATEDRQVILNMMQQDFTGGLYGNIQDPETMLNLWKDRDQLGYPGAKRQVARWQKKVEELKKMQAMQQQFEAMKQMGDQTVPGEEYGDEILDEGIAEEGMEQEVPDEM